MPSQVEINCHFTDMSNPASTNIPIVSVVLSVRNGEAYLREAIESILNQRFTDFELIIVDNHSTDSSAEIVESYDDARIILTRPDEPLHLAQALNHAASMARGEYVARMDADDVSHPARFEKQVQYMREHPSVGILGSQIRPIDGDGKLIAKGSYRKPEAHEDICWSLLFGCPLWHPTVMLRKAVIDELGWYGSSAIEGREQYSTEDYDLWCRAIAHTKIHNLPEILLDYRIHADNHSLGKSRLKEHRRNVVLVLTQYIKTTFAMDASHVTCAALLGLKPGDVADLEEAAHHPKEMAQLTRCILDANAKNGIARDEMRHLKQKLASVAEALIWQRGFNIMRESIALLKVDAGCGMRVLWSSLRRFI